MSLPQTNSSSSSLPKGTVTAAVVVVGTLALFLVIFLISRQTPTPVADASASEELRWKFTEAGRAAKLAEIRGKEQSASTSYGWVDQQNGVVRLPLDRAVELTIRDINAAKK